MCEYVNECVDVCVFRREREREERRKRKRRGKEKGERVGGVGGCWAHHLNSVDPCLPSKSSRDTGYLTHPHLAGLAELCRVCVASLQCPWEDNAVPSGWLQRCLLLQHLFCYQYKLPQLASLSDISGASCRLWHWQKGQIALFLSMLSVQGK